MTTVKEFIKNKTLIALLTASTLVSPVLSQTRSLQQLAQKTNIANSLLKNPFKDISRYAAPNFVLDESTYSQFQRRQEDVTRDGNLEDVYSNGMNTPQLAFTEGKLIRVYKKTSNEPNVVPLNNRLADIEYSYDTKGHLEEVETFYIHNNQQLWQSTDTFSYDSHGNIKTKHREQPDRKSTVSYDIQGNLISITEDWYDKNKGHSEFDQWNRVVAHEDQFHGATKVKYHHNDHLDKWKKQTIHHADNTISFGTHRLAKRIERTNNGVRTTFEYDTQGELSHYTIFHLQSGSISQGSKEDARRNRVHIPNANLSHWGWGANTSWSTASSWYPKKSIDQLTQ